MKQHYLMSCLVALCLFTSARLPAQQIEWIKQMQGHPGTSLPDDITSDAAGNVYVVGHFDESIDFDPNEDQEILTSAGGLDVFVQKLNPDGQLLWVHRIGGAGTDRVRDVKLDANGDVFVAGSVFGAVDLDPGPGEVRVESNTSGAFILKLDAQGQYLWSYHTSGEGSTSPFALNFDPEGNIYSTGVHSGQMDFDAGPAENTLEAGTTGDIYLLKINNAGQFIWARSFGSSFFDRGRNVIADSTGVYLQVDYFAELTVGMGNAATTIPHNETPGFDAAILKFDPQGDLLWFKNHSTPAIDAIAVRFADASNVYITAAGIPVRYSSDGTLIDTLKHPLGGLPVLDNNGLAIRAGSWSGRRDFDPGPDSLIRTSSLNVGGNFDRDIFAMRFDASFLPEWILTATSTEQLLYRGGSLGTPDVFYFTSEHRLDMTVATETDTLIVPGDGSNAVFVVKLRTCSPSRTTLDIVACDAYMFGDQLLTASGSYADTLTGRAGCDSIVDLTLTIEQLVANIMVTDSSLMTSLSDVNHQWLNCSQGFSVVEGANQAEFVPENADEYAVEITLGSCRDTTMCASVMTTSAQQLAQEIFDLSPNPVQNELFINLPDIAQAAFRIYSMSGQLIQQGQFYANQPLAVGHLSPSAYVILVQDQERQFYSKFIKH